MSNEDEVLQTAKVSIPIYRGSVEYGLEQNNIDATEENVQKAAKLMREHVERMEWYEDDEPLFGDNAAESVIDNNKEKF